MKKTDVFVATALSLLSILSSSLPALSCSFMSQTYFTYSTHPDLPLNSYAAGKLGILQPGFARSYLLVAHDYLSGKKLSEAQQKQMLELWKKRLTSSDYAMFVDTSAWLKAREQVPNAAKISQLYAERPVSKDEPYEQYCNCQPAAFKRASDKLQELIGKHGAASNEVKQWLSAQDMVFANCGAPPYSDKVPSAQIPQPLNAASAGAMELNERAYQIAAANFYAQNFAQAFTEFEAIAANPVAPMRQIAAYLAVRCLVRQATLAKNLDKGLLEKAFKKITELKKQKDFASLQEDLDALAGFISVRLNPVEHLKELCSKPLSEDTACELTKTIDHLIGDYEPTPPADTKYSEIPAALKNPELLDWISCFKSGDQSAKAHALAQYKNTGASAWLLAAASKLDGKDAALAEIINAAEQNQDPYAHWTIFYHMNRLKLLQGKKEEVRQALDKVLSGPAEKAPGLGAMNQLKTLRLPLANSLEELVKFGFQTPQAECNNGGTEEVPDDIDQIIDGKAGSRQKVFTPDAGYVMDSKLPLSLLKELAQNKDLPASSRSNIAFSSWVRAVLVDDDAAAKELALIMKPLNSSRAKLIDAYLAATDPASRKFAAAFLMLKYSSANPNPAWGPLSEDSYGDASGWWWGSSPLASEPEGLSSKFEVLFLKPEQKSRAAQELKKLEKIETAPNYLSKIVIAYAQSHPADARVPEALHFAVKSTRYGSTDDTSKLLSKQAFQILHSKYKGNPWTAKTPYYY